MPTIRLPSPCAVVWLQTSLLFIGDYLRFSFSLWFLAGGCQEKGRMFFNFLKSEILPAPLYVVYSLRGQGSPPSEEATVGVGVADGGAVDRKGHVGMSLSLHLARVAISPFLCWMFFLLAQSLAVGQ